MKKKRARETDPRRLPVSAFCEAGSVLEGSWALADLPRLAAAAWPAEAGAGDSSCSVNWRVSGELRRKPGRAPEHWLTVEADGPLRLQCQRCLQALVEPLRVRRRLLFVEGEDEAARLDEEMEEDVLALPPRLDLRDLVEDELILALPLVPRHAVCPEPLAAPSGQSRIEREGPAAEGRQNPFAVLEALRQPPEPGDGHGPQR